MFNEKHKCGLSLVSTRKGDGPCCRIERNTGEVVYSGTYAACVRWLKDRNAY